MNHVFVDFENVRHVDLTVIGDKSVSFTLLVGAKCTRLDLDLVEKMMRHASSVSLVRLTSVGKNALDFALAYYMGRAAVADPAGYFHIVSRDTGFDPLVEHLRGHGVRARRHDDFSALSFSAKSAVSTAKKEPVAKTKVSRPEDLKGRALEHLRKQSANQPRRKTALVRDLMSLLKPATEAEAQKVVNELEAAGHIAVSATGAVSYSL